LTADEFAIAMHCCDLAHMGQPLPAQLPEEWLQTNTMQRERSDTPPKPAANQTYAHLNQQLQETINATHQAQATPANPPAEPTEAERKLIAASYEEKRLKNYEVCRFALQELVAIRPTSTRTVTVS
jgi:phosphate uptake regulator